MSLKDYIHGNRRGKEANRLEREALNDPFLQEVLEGFETVTGNHSKIVGRLEKRFSSPAVAAHRKKKNVFLFWPVAASVLLVIGLCAYFLLNESKRNIPMLAENQPILNESVIAADSFVLQPDLKYNKISQPESMIVAKENKKVVRTPASKSISSDLHKNESMLSVAEVADSKSDLSESSIAEYSEKSMDKQTIRGKVVDETGEPLVGAAVVKKGAQNGTVTGIDGDFALQLPEDDSSKLIASYLGYVSKEITPSDNYQIVALKPNNNALSEVVVIGYGTQKKSNKTGSVSIVSENKVRRGNDSIQISFGEKEFQTYCRLKANKNVCNGGGAWVKVSFFINETGKPAKIEYKNYSCEDAKKEMDDLFSSSPAWTSTNRNVTMTIKW